MKAKSAWIGFFALAAVTFAGCHIMVDDDQQWWYYCDATGCYRCDARGCEFPPDHNNPFYCYEDSDCPSGSCDQVRGVCVSNPSKCDVSKDCSAGYVCVSGSCTPGRTPCPKDDACGDGAYCSNGKCKDSCRCKGDQDCQDKMGDGFVCDPRGSCIPGQTGPKSCTDAKGCGEGMCVDGKCGTCTGDCGGGQSCTLQVHCGEGRACLNGQCVNSCSKPSDCGSTQTCKSNICVGKGPGTCVKDSDCGSGQLCINKVCHADCTSSGTCSNAADVCSAVITVGQQSLKACVPNHSAKPQCTLTKDCEGGEQCVNGICRTTCAKTEDCEVCDDGPVCGPGGFCMTQQEVKPDCTANSDCTGGKFCLNTQCVAL
jgi:hypothetical protein